MTNVINQTFGSVRKINEIIDSFTAELNKNEIGRREASIAMALIFLSTADGVLFGPRDKINKKVKAISVFYRNVLKASERSEV